MRGRGIVTALAALAAILGGTTMAQAQSTTNHLTAEEAKLPEYHLIVFSRPVSPAREEEFNRWYTDQHVGDLLKVPGIVAGQRFRLALDLASPADVPPYLVIFDYRTNDLAGLASETIRRMQQKVFVPSDSMDYEALASGIYRPLGKLVEATSPQPPAPIAGKPVKRYIMVVLSSPVAGKEAEYNRWYDQEHLPAVLRVPGVRSAQRYQQIEPVKAPTHALPAYMVRYEVDSADPAATRDEIMRRIKSGETKMSDAFDMTTAITRFYEAVMPVLYAHP